LARAAAAHDLVSGDRHLLGLANPDPPVVTAQRFLELIEAGGA
jgi:predicted nucleic acid-binding protein